MTALMFLVLLSATPTPIPVSVIGQWDVYEVRLQTPPGWNNPFTDVTLYGEFVHTSTQAKKWVKGFYKGANTFMVRYRPDVPGDYTYQTWSEPAVPALASTGVFRVTAPRANNHGPIKRDGKFLKYADGTDYGHTGGTAFGLAHAISPVPWVQDMVNRGVMYFRIGLNITWGRGDTAGQITGCGDAGLVNGCWLNTFAWSFSPYPANRTHDWSQMNTSRFDRLDDVMNYLLANGCTAELSLFDSSMKYVFGPNETAYENGTLYTVGDPRQVPFIDYMARRYGAYPNFWWEIGNEIRHNSFKPWQEEWPAAKRWVDWLGTTLKSLTPDHLVAYDAMWTDTDWEYAPTRFGLSAPYPVDVWHAPLWAASWCDIVNIHTDRSGEWWWKTAEQIQCLINYYSKPASADEPHRKGYSYPVTDQEVRRAMWMTALTGSGLYTNHGVSNNAPCLGCIEAGDIPQADLHTKFFKRAGKWNFHPDWSLITGAGVFQRAMHRDGTYVYLTLDAKGACQFKTLQSGDYEFYTLDIGTGWESTASFTGTSFEFTYQTQSDYVTLILPRVPPTPTPTNTPTVVPTPTKTPTSNVGPIACDQEASAWSNTTERNADDFAVSLLTGILLVIGFVAVRRGLQHGKR